MLLSQCARLCQESAQLFVQEWNTSLHENSKCMLYENIKTVFNFESYLVRLPRNVWRYIVKFRCCNHKLAIETGCYVGLDRHLRYCNMCSMNVLGDEYHIFFECTNPCISDLRTRFIPQYLDKTVV